MIPETVDALDLIFQLNRLGWPDYKIEIQCQFAKGYISGLKAHHVKNPRYSTAARLYNLHETVNSQTKVKRVAETLHIIAA